MIDLSKFKASNVEEMMGIFQSCVLFKSLDISNFDFSKAYDMSLIFNQCNSLTELKAKFNAKEVKDLYKTFGDAPT